MNCGGEARLPWDLPPQVTALGISNFILLVPIATVTLPGSRRVRDSGWGRTGRRSLDDFSDLIRINPHSGQRQYPF